MNKSYPKVLLGYNDEEPIYLSPPKWDCGWYWGWGYLGNKNCHYHVEGLKKISKYNRDKQVFEYEFVNLKDGFDKHFKETFIIRPSHRWQFSELFETFYTLKEVAEVYNRGGSHLTTNPCRDIIKNQEEVKRINEVILPAIFEKTYDIIEQNLNNQALYKTLVELNTQGDTKAVIDFMFEYNIYTDDLGVIPQITQHDFNNIHTHYWKKKYETTSKTNT